MNVNRGVEAAMSRGELPKGLRRRPLLRKWIQEKIEQFLAGGLRVGYVDGAGTAWIVAVAVGRKGDRCGNALAEGSNGLN